MNWSEINIWKQSFVSTFICLIGCSIGSMGITVYLTNYPLLFVLLISLITGFITCIAFMIIWRMLFHQMNLKEAFISSYKMSLVSMLIMMLTENIVMLFIAPQMSHHNMHNMNSMDMPTHNVSMMILAMGLGFILAIPYNYYQLQKTGKICH